MPLMISSMKVAAAIRSKPVTIFLFRVTPRGSRRRSNLEDRIHPTLSARVPSTFQGVCHLRAGTRTSGSVSVAKGHGSRLRSGLAAGGKRLRTLGPRYIDDAFETILVAWLAFAFLPEGPTRSQGGTAGSNPLSSSGESDKLAGPDRQLGRLNGIWERQRKRRPYWAPRESRREAPRSKCRA